MDIVLASGNTHKSREIEAAFPDAFNVIPQSKLGISSPPETGTTFVENALIKAHHACQASGMPAIADDSGICIEALGRSPGVRSARFAGEDATDEDNNRKLLASLAGIDNRTATFYCVLVFLASPDDPAPVIAEGKWHGEIALKPAGQEGFGYDPLFYIPSLSKTAAQLPATEKNRLSHRGQALRRLTEVLIERYPP